jgi:hypothetical protein
VRATLVAALLAGLFGCAEELTPQSLVYDMRVLAVRAEPAAAAPGETVRLDALVVDPFGGDRDLSLLWAACVNPPADNPVRCLETATPQVLGEEDAVEAVIPDDALADRQRGTLGVLLFVCAGGTLTLGERGATCAGDDTAQIVAVKRVPIEAEPDNENPEIAGVLFDGEPFGESDLPAVPSCSGDCTAHRLTVRASDESAETYQDDDAELREELISSFSATSGQMEVPFGFGATTEVEWTPPLGTGLVLFWFALRDDRGGVTWVERQALVD